MSDEGPRILNLILDEVKSIRIKVDKSDERLDLIDVTLVKQNATLEEHVRRSELMEERAEKIELEIEPLKKRAAQMDGVLKFLGITGTVIAIVVGLIEFIKTVF